MNKITILICLLPIVLLLSGLTKNNNTQPKTGMVIIKGKILNFSPDKKDVVFYVQRLGLAREVIYAKLDNLGKFSVAFESYIPTEVTLEYRTNFIILTHPKDNIYVEFDGKQEDRPELLKTIKYSGDATITNRQASAFQRLYFSSPLYTEMLKRDIIQKKYDLNQYKLYLDSLLLKNKNFFENFVAKVSPNEETKIWAKTYIEGDYYEALLGFPDEHQRANKISENDWNVPSSYYDPIMNRFPITKSMLISCSALNDFMNSYRNWYVQKKIKEEFEKRYKKGVGIPGTEIDVTMAYYDSLSISCRIKNTPDSLSRQLVLTDLFRRKFDENDITFFEKHRNVVDKYIHEPYLKNPLLTKYEQTKNNIENKRQFSANVDPLLENDQQKKKNIENPSLVPSVIMKTIDNSSVKQIIDNIRQVNKGKVIYIDCWATWCGPCLAEMPNQKKLMKSMEGKEVAFVYLCLDSEEKLWKSMVIQYEMYGQNYFLTKGQSTTLRKTFAIDGIPFYFLIDKKGTIIEKGSHLRPDYVTGVINALIRK